MNFPYKKIGWLVILCMIGMVIVVLHNHFSSAALTPPIYEAHYGTIAQKVAISGHIVPKRETVITAPYSGYIKKIYVDIGDSIKPGMPLVSVAESLQSNETVYPMRAPYAGTVVMINKTEGQYVWQSTGNAQSNYMMKIDDCSEFFISGTVSEMDLPYLKKGQAADITVIPLLHQHYHGYIDNIAQTNQEQTSSQGILAPSQILYPLLIKISDADTQIKPGMSAIVAIVVRQKKHVIVLPIECINTAHGKYFVTLRNGKKRSISLGLMNDNIVEITQGIHVGDKVRQVDFFNSGAV